MYDQISQHHTDDKLGQYEKNKANTEKQGQYENDVIRRSFSKENGSHVFLRFAASKLQLYLYQKTYTAVAFIEVEIIVNSYR